MATQTERPAPKGHCLVRGTYENVHGYRCEQVVTTSSGREHDKAFLAGGFPPARNIHVLEVLPAPEDLLREGRIRSLMAYVSLAGGNEMHLTLDEYVGVMRRAVEEAGSAHAVTKLWEDLHK